MLLDRFALPASSYLVLRYDKTYVIDRVVAVSRGARMCFC
jgi:hypothetical protein